MADETIRLAGILLVLVPTVAFGGETILRMAHLRDDAYLRNPVRRRLWIAGHAHAGVLLLLALVALLYVDAAESYESVEVDLRVAVGPLHGPLCRRRTFPRIAFDGHSAAVTSARGAGRHTARSSAAVAVKAAATRKVPPPPSAS